MQQLKRFVVKGELKIQKDSRILNKQNSYQSYENGSQKGKNLRKMDERSNSSQSIIQSIKSI